MKSGCWMVKENKENRWCKHRLFNEINERRWYSRKIQPLKVKEISLVVGTESKVFVYADFEWLKTVCREKDGGTKWLPVSRSLRKTSWWIRLIWQRRVWAVKNRVSCKWGFRGRIIDFNTVIVTRVLH